MRYVVIIFLLTLSLSVSAQIEPFKGAKVITISSNDSSSTLFKSFGQHVTSKGLIIDNSDTDFLTLKTAPIPTSRFNIIFYLNATVIENKIRLNAFYKINTDHLVGVGASSFNFWEYRAGKDNIMNVIHGDILKILHGFPKLSIEYSK